MSEYQYLYFAAIDNPLDDKPHYENEDCCQSHEIGKEQDVHIISDFGFQNVD
jgi:hypothetical protein